MAEISETEQPVESTIIAAPESLLQIGEERFSPKYGFTAVSKEKPICAVIYDAASIFSVSGSVVVDVMPVKNSTVSEYKQSLFDLMNALALASGSSHNKYASSEAAGFQRYGNHNILENASKLPEVKSVVCSLDNLQRQLELKSTDVGSKVNKNMSNNQRSNSDQLKRLEERINATIYLSEFWRNIEDDSSFALMGPKEKAHIGWKDRMQYHLSVATVSGSIMVNVYDKNAFVLHNHTANGALKVTGYGQSKDARLISLLSLNGDITVKYLWKK